MHALRYSEFYITNVCNLNCDNCNRYNNLAFSGHYRWQDHSNEYQQWAKLITFKRLAILGGEPLLNPGFMDWLHGIAELWPDAEIDIVTNGTQLDRWPTLYQELLSLGGRAYLEINQHSEAGFEATKQKIKSFLVGDIQERRVEGADLWSATYNKIKDASWPSCNEINDFYHLPTAVQQECRELHKFSPEAWFEAGGKENNSVCFTDSNGIRVELLPAWRFHESSLRIDRNSGTLSLHRSDPVRAMTNCNFKMCHHFIEGRLYKCGPVGILPEFIKQFPVDITASEHALINSYVPAEHTWSQDQLDSFLENLTQAIPVQQCQFCPEKFTPKKFSASTKKIKIVKLAA
jgi:organic radical activating enzyme